MNLKAEWTTDVLVMGAGLSGIMAAISAAEAGARVIITSSTKICSGSSFYPGTWGLGLVGPESQEDETDLIGTILRVGEGMADPKLVAAFVSDIREGIQYLKDMGVKLKQTDAGAEKEFIPCFDHKHRNWNGFIKQEAEEIFLDKMKKLGIQMLSETEIIRLVKREGTICGAVALKKSGEPVYIAAGSVVIASGGIGGLFEYRLNTSDIAGMGQYLALSAGASLINLEFFQMMLGHIAPSPKTIYNEKMFRYSQFQDPDTGLSVFDGMSTAEVECALKIHSTHGPFTTRLGSGIVDETIYRGFLKNRRGIKVEYKKEIMENQPEFVRTYFVWLKEKKGLTMRDPIWLGMFAHASNGGIKIDEKASCAVSGLYACGEAAGGMHGADRLGGLSTANGLVFGRIAGREAAAWSKGALPVTEIMEKFVVIQDAKVYLRQIQSMNSTCSMICRSREDGRHVQEMMEKITHEMQEMKSNYEGLRETYHLFAAIALTKCLSAAILLREESRGPHNRTDFPYKDLEMNKRIISRISGGIIRTKFETGNQEDHHAGRFFS